MALFKRMREMARAVAENRHEPPHEDDMEGTIAVAGLDKIWAQTLQQANRWRLFSKKITEEQVRSKEYLPRVLENIDRVESLVFDNWDLGHDEVSYVKQFRSVKERQEVNEWLAMVDFADGGKNGSVSLQVEDAAGPDEKELEEISTGFDPDEPLEHTEARLATAQEALTHHALHARRLAVNATLLDAIAELEDKKESLPVHAR